VLTVADILDEPLLRDARCIAAQQELSRREISWFSVIEWPAEDFVRSGDLVMTTGVGCDPARFSRHVAQIVAARPAGVFVALPDRNQFAQIPPGAIRAAAKAGIPLAEVPWRIRFAEIARIVVDGVEYGRQPKTAPPATDGLNAALTVALVEGHGSPEIARITERDVGGPVLVLGADLQVEAAGPRAQAELGEHIATCNAAAKQFDTTELLATRHALESPEAMVSGLSRLGLPAGVIAPAGARWRSGYVFMPAQQSDGNLRALRQAAHAVGIEQLRARAIDEAEVRACGHLVWAIARGDISDPDEIKRRALLTGLRHEANHAVALGLLSSGSSASNDAVTLDAVTIPRLRRHGVHALPSIEGVLAVWPGDPGHLARLLVDAPGATWGVAETQTRLTALRETYVRARDTALTAVALGQHGGVSLERDLGPHLLLTGLRNTEAADRTIESVLGALVDYDRRSGRNLSRTLRVYLETQGNTSEAARRLHLNRHSLLYRLKKIEKLTGRDLADGNERFLFDLTLRLAALGSGDSAYLDAAEQTSAC
jgi:PucR family transcriptional regulator, purine catabolism regulatory protein